MSVPDVPERLLRHIWAKQLFSAATLYASDGRQITIVSPGTANHDGGPDFIDAQIRIGTSSYVGDVELHQNAHDWITHGHNNDPHYNKVILHVVLTAEPLPSPTRTLAERSVPLLVLHPFLDTVLQEALLSNLLSDNHNAEAAPRCPGVKGPTFEQDILHHLQKLANERIELKVRRFEERLRQLSNEYRTVSREPYPRYYGNPNEIPPPREHRTRRDLSAGLLWEQLLYEGIMEAAGYSKNSVPFRVLAQAVPLETLRRYALDDTHTIMAVLFGVAGLLPVPSHLQEMESRRYVRILRRRWKQVRSEYTGPLLNEGDWLFFRLRPYNFPTARLATICFLLPVLFGRSLLRRVIEILQAEEPSPLKRLHSLSMLFRFQPDAYWQRHYHFRSGPGGRGISLGESRIHEIVVNVLIPIGLLYARIFNIHVLRHHGRSTLCAIPPLPGNAITRKVQGTLLGTNMEVKSAFLQQGLIQLYRFYCSAKRCTECPVSHDAAIE